MDVHPHQQRAVDPISLWNGRRGTLYVFNCAHPSFCRLTSRKYLYYKPLLPRRRLEPTGGRFREQNITTLLP